LSRCQISIRLNETQRERLKSLAQARGVHYSDLIRSLINNYIMNGEPDDVKARVNKLIKELREPFAYFKTAVGNKHAIKERWIREHIAHKLSEVYRL